jgi:hypothetical protein
MRNNKWREGTDICRTVNDLSQYRSGLNKGKTNINIIHLPTPKSAKRSYSFGFLAKLYMQSSYSACVLHSLTIFYFLLSTPDYFMLLSVSRDSSVGIAMSTGWTTRGVDSLSPGRVKNYFSISSRPALGSTQLPVKWVPGALSRV